MSDTPRRPPKVSPYLPTVMFFALSAYFFYDGWLNPEMAEHRTFNRVGAFVLLGLGIVDWLRMRRRIQKRAAERASGAEG